MSEPQPFTIEWSDDAIDDLRERLARTRWPEAETVDDWSQGVPLAYVQELCGYWADGYDWRRARGAAQRASRSSAPRSTGSASTSCTRARRSPTRCRWCSPTVGRARSSSSSKVIGPLTDPAAHGGDPADAFHVVVPVAAGLRVQRQADRAGLGHRAHRRGVGRADGAPRLRALRRAGRRLGRDGDHGARPAATPSTSPASTSTCRSRCPTGDADDRPPTPEQARARRACKHYRRPRHGLLRRSSRPGRRRSATGSPTRPPAQCAWIVEKFWAWTDCDGHPENALTRDQMLDNIMLYWLHATGTSSARLYWESFTASTGTPIDAPVGRLDLPEGDHPPVAAVGRDALHRPALVRRARPWRPLRRLRAARASSSTRSAASSAPCAEVLRPGQRTRGVCPRRAAERSERSRGCERGCQRDGRTCRLVARPSSSSLRGSSIGFLTRQSSPIGVDHAPTRRSR